MDSSILLIRADGSSRIGAGHVMRCLAIAQAWSDRGGLSAFVSAEIPLELKERITAEGFQCVQIHSPAGTLDDASELISLVKGRNAQALILDGYQFDERYHEVISMCGSITLAIDDHGSLPHYSTNFVLNQNLGATAESYSTLSDHTELLLGSQYALLRREFRQRGSRRRFRSQQNGLRCLITLGGSDFENVTEKAIQGLQLLDVDGLEVRTIVGALNPHGPYLADLVSGDTRFSLLSNVSDMADQYAWADFAIAAGGSSNWEMCYFGLPRIVVVIAENQRLIAEQLHREQVAINVGERANISPERIAEAIHTFLHDEARLSFARLRAVQLVDGFGATRCVNRLLGLAETFVFNQPGTHS
jgi:UDP-2,4-diacetamido-2,4,6-trideoxy-beta-L-altropyranose hydrolase